MFNKYLIVSLCFFNITIVYADSFYLNRLYSENKKIYLETIKFKSYTDNNEGQTKIYKSIDSSFIYGLDKWVNTDYTFISNDGVSIIYINRQKSVIERYELGVLKNEINFCEIINDNYINDNSECKLLYSNPDLRLLLKDENGTVTGMFGGINYQRDTTNKEKYTYIYKSDAIPQLVFADKNPVFSYNDTLFIISSRLLLIKIDLKKFEIIYSDFYKNYEYLQQIVNFKNSIDSKYEYEDIDFPKLKNGMNFIDKIRERFDYMFDTGFSNSPPFYYKNALYHEFLLGGLLDRQGKFHTSYLKISGYIDSIEFYNFIDSLEFEPLEMPNVVDNWYYSNSLYFRKQDLTESINDNKIQDSINQSEIYRLRKLDTIDGVYIPIDINDCHSELDKKLHKIILSEIDSLKKSSDMSKYHFSIGRWIRNIWHLWSGSRIEEYLFQNGLSNPDEMSDIILKTYFYHRHKIEFDLKNVLNNDKEEFKKLLKK